MHTDKAGSPPKGLHIFCPACHAQLGHYAVRAAAATLFKWAVTVEGCAQEGQAPPTAATCLVAALVAGMARTGSSKALVLPMHRRTDMTDSVLLVQMLNGSLSCASSEVADGRAVPAAKVLYRFVGPKEADAMLESVTAEVQEVHLPAAAVAELVAGLDRSCGLLLPASGREFRGARVGLLRRWAG